MKKLLVFDSHPVQYRVPIWQAMNAMAAGCAHVAYATDSSVKGHADKEFGQVIAWDEPLLSGYEHSILHSENGTPLTGWKSLSGKGVEETLNTVQPHCVLLTGLNYRYDWAAYRAARKKGIPVWLRCETQDFATPRSRVKQFIRSLVYKSFYRGIARFFYIGELNKQHYLSLGVPGSKLSPALYGTVYRYEGVSDERKALIGKEVRSEENIAVSDFVIGFSGKFIYKKNPDILYSMLQYLPDAIRKKTVLYFMGSGEMEAELKNAAIEAATQYGVRSIFKGFINQSKIGAHYLAMDILVLPSRQMGETWGLVVNEALQAGCGVVVSNAVGSSANFGNLQRFRTFEVGDAKGLSEKVIALAAYDRSFSWALPALQPYSIAATAQAFLQQLA